MFHIAGTISAMIVMMRLPSLPPLLRLVLVPTCVDRSAGSFPKLLGASLGITRGLPAITSLLCLRMMKLLLARRISVLSSTLSTVAPLALWSPLLLLHCAWTSGHFLLPLARSISSSRPKKRLLVISPVLRSRTRPVPTICRPLSSLEVLSFF